MQLCRAEQPVGQILQHEGIRIKYKSKQVSRSSAFHGDQWYFWTTKLIFANRIVTGIRFSKLGRMIHLQVEQGDLLPDGEVTNLEWINVDEFQPDATNLVKFTGEVSTRGRVPVEGTDWVAISWRERAVDLDDVASPPGHCVTGIDNNGKLIHFHTKWYLIFYYLIYPSNLFECYPPGVRLRKVNSHLRLEIRSTPFELTTGKLIDPLTKSFWHGNDDTSRK